MEWLFVYVCVLDTSISLHTLQKSIAIILMNISIVVAFLHFVTFSDKKNKNEHYNGCLKGPLDGLKTVFIKIEHTVSSIHPRLVRREWMMKWKAEDNEWANTAASNVIESILHTNWVFTSVTINVFAYLHFVVSSTYFSW